MHRRTPGIATTVTMAFVLVLAHGIPGVAQESPSMTWTRQQLQQRISADANVWVIGDPLAGELPPAVRRHRTKPRRKAAHRPFSKDYRIVALREAKRAHIRQPKLFVRQMAAESGFQPCAMSGAGAVGIAQIMPSTARAWHVDPFEPETALRVAARHMAAYERAFGSYAVASAAYNAGVGAVMMHGGVPPYAETRAYVARITNRRIELLGMNQVYRLPPGMRSGFATRLQRLRKQVRRQGGRLVVADGWRTYGEQRDLWQVAKRRYGGWQAARRWVAPPGCSNHNRGLAADLSGSLGLAHRLAPRFGLVFPMGHEPWHIEMAGIPSQSG